jgi:hypothetical protein
MAIYTNYGRYLKAKQFKEMLENYCDTYMVFGLGNPQWDAAEPQTPQDIPVAPYNTSVLTESEDNQFYDKHVNLYFNDTNGNVVSAITNSEPNTPELVGKYFYACKDLNPPFPCIWSYPSNDDDFTIVNLTMANTGEQNATISITQNNYQHYYIQKDAASGDFILYSPSNDNTAILPPPTNSLSRQYFSEMYLRGTAIANGIKAPVGLLGAIKCNIDFVKDIGTDDSVYTGDITQFWYGDRYWETVNVPDPMSQNNTPVDISDYIGKSTNQEIYPHHLIFTATVHPRILCPELQFDQYIVPRQIGIFTVKKSTGENATDRPKYYRASENVFDFGQYNANDGYPAIGTGTAIKDILKFALPCSVEGYKTNKGEFEFLLNDYIRGQVRTVHTVDRFGYVVGF